MSSQCYCDDRTTLYRGPIGYVEQCDDCGLIFSGDNEESSEDE